MHVTTQSVYAPPPLPPPVYPVPLVASGDTEIVGVVIGIVVGIFVGTAAIVRFRSWFISRRTQLVAQQKLERKEAYKDHLRQEKSRRQAETEETKRRRGILNLGWQPGGAQAYPRAAQRSAPAVCFCGSTLTPESSALIHTLTSPSKSLSPLPFPPPSAPPLTPSRLR